jgi:hypothetical protein
MEARLPVGLIRRGQRGEGRIDPGFYQVDVCANVRSARSEREEEILRVPGRALQKITDVGIPQGHGIRVRGVVEGKDIVITRRPVVGKRPVAVQCGHGEIAGQVTEVRAGAARRKGALLTRVAIVPGPVLRRRRDSEKKNAESRKHAHDRRSSSQQKIHGILQSGRENSPAKELILFILKYHCSPKPEDIKQTNLRTWGRWMGSKGRRRPVSQESEACHTVLKTRF